MGYLTETTCIVLVKPQIFRNESNQLHNEYNTAIKWKDDGIYFLDGIQLDKDIWKKIVSKIMSFAEIMQIENADVKAIALRYNPESILNANAKLIDKSIRNNELYLIKDTELNTFLDEKEVYFLKMNCPTGRIFIEGIEPNFAMNNPNADVCQAWLCGITPETYRNLTIEG